MLTKQNLDWKTFNQWVIKTIGRFNYKKGLFYTGQQIKHNDTFLREGMCTLEGIKGYLYIIQGNSLLYDRNIINLN